MAKSHADYCADKSADETSINKLLEAFGKFDESGIKLHPKAFLVPCILVLNLQKKVIRRNLHDLSKKNSINNGEWNAGQVIFLVAMRKLTRCGGKVAKITIMVSLKTFPLKKENV